VHGSPGGPSLEKKGLRFDVEGLENGTSGRTSVSDVVLQWLISASTGICAQSNREVHRASTSDGMPGGQPNRVFSPRRTAQKKTTSQFTSSCFGLVQESRKWHKEHALSSHAKSESSRMGRDWPVKPTIRELIVTSALVDAETSLSPIRKTRDSPMPSVVVAFPG
jgi:hypothetical protein